MMPPAGKGPSPFAIPEVYTYILQWYGFILPPKRRSTMAVRKCIMPIILSILLLSSTQDAANNGTSTSNWSLPPAKKTPTPPKLIGVNGNYPTNAIRHMLEGSAVFLANINEYGQVTKCEIIESSGSEDLDRATCEAILNNARFTPAHDENGQAVPGIFSKKFTWKLPDVTVPLQLRQR